ncbi:Hypothetical_protein [Hexamita inflata]|uniref:Hypothetical_protein n=1 Tax=Hexamita inflata TaxID=28002 RepID=A0AA86V6K1_9EUKA|nr:Hypothetical protein HINF_LOCUS45738 [Hexamita inflata]
MNNNLKRLPTPEDIMLIYTHFFNSIFFDEYNKIYDAADCAGWSISTVTKIITLCRELNDNRKQSDTDLSTKLNCTESLVTNVRTFFENSWQEFQPNRTVQFLKNQLDELYNQESSDDENVEALLAVTLVILKHKKMIKQIKQMVSNIPE